MISSRSYEKCIEFISYVSYFSFPQSERVAASKILEGPPQEMFTGDKKEFIENIRQVCVAMLIVD